MSLIGKLLLKYDHKLPWAQWGPVYQLRSRLESRKIFSDRHEFRKTRVGQASYVDPSVRIIGWRNVVIGSNTTLSEDVWLNVNHRDDGINRIIIGNNCHIGKRNFISSGPLITLKDYCFTGIDCHFLGSGHVIDSPLVPYIASGLTTGAVIEIGVNCWLTTSVTVLQGVKIGHGSVIGARAVVLNDIPPFSIAVGNPCMVIKRFDFKNNVWIDAQNWSDELNSLIPTEEDYLRRLIERYSAIPLSLVSSSRRFGWL
jgi:acetyltransferase-like isoleucine patch superfamily enzyme